MVAITLHPIPSNMSHTNRDYCLVTKYETFLMVNTSFWTDRLNKMTTSTATAAVRILPNNKVYRQLFDAQVIIY